MLKAYDLDGRVAIVTGGGTNLGAAIAKLLALSGAKVVVAARRIELLERTAAEINATTPGTAAVVQADLTRSDSVDGMIANTIEEFGRLDILVNNAGAPAYASIADVTDESWRASFAVNVDTAFYCARAAYPHLKESGRGAVVNISSLAVRQLAANGAAYAAAKAALEMFTRTSAAAWGPDGIRVNCVAPGYFPTEENRARLRASGMDPEAAGRMFALRRTGRPEEIAHAVHFLASDAASYITGETLTVSGGPPAAA